MSGFLAHTFGLFAGPWLSLCVRNLVCGVGHSAVTLHGEVLLTSSAGYFCLPLDAWPEVYLPSVSPGVAAVWAYRGVTVFGVVGFRTMSVQRIAGLSGLWRVALHSYIHGFRGDSLTSVFGISIRRWDGPSVHQSGNQRHRAQCQQQDQEDRGVGHPCRTNRLQRTAGLRFRLLHTSLAGGR